MGQQDFRGNPPTILLVEDDADQQEVLGLYLRQNGYSVLEVGNGQQAIEIAQQMIPDLIIMDLAMPVLGGHAAAIHIRQQQALRNIPIIFMTAYGLRAIDLFSDQDRAHLEPFDYVPKPIEDFGQLGDLIERLLAQK